MKTQINAYFEFVARTPVLITGFVASMLFVLVIFPQLAGQIESLDTRMGGLYAG